MDDRGATLRRSAAHVFVTDLVGDAIGLDEETEHHLDRVLRLRDGEVVTVSDGAGSWCTARVVRAGGIRLERSGATRTERRSRPALTIATAIPKGDRIDWLVQKTTELGVDRIVLTECERSVVRWRDDRVGRHLTRLRRIAEEAGRQSRRVWRTVVEGPVPSGSVLGEAAVAEPDGRSVEAGDDLIAIGPEGGWSTVELDRANERVDLGPTILRTETAAVAATVLATAARRSADA
jgi:16S rRNA (uracil1498-N3)-methyltransferase